MKSIRAISVIITLMLVFFACGNKSIKTEPVLNDEMTESVSLHPDTTLHSVKAEEMKVMRNQLHLSVPPHRLHHALIALVVMIICVASTLHLKMICLTMG